MKIIAKDKAYFNGEIIKEGQVIDFSGKKIPSWANELKIKEEKENTENKDKEVLFDELLTKALDKNIELDLENKTIEEKIVLLEKALGEVK